jgi:hypothetical protein
MPSGSKRMKSTRMRPKMPGSSPGCFTKRSVSRNTAALASAPSMDTAPPIHAGTESRPWEISTGRKATNTAPNRAPCRLPSPPTTTMSRNWMERSTLKMSGAR